MTIFLRWVLAFGAAVLMSQVWAQVQRQFPATALRGEIVFGTPPEVVLNSEPLRLAPGARIRALNNMIVLSGTLMGGRFTVHYTTDPQGQLKDVWILRPEEIANQPWPGTAKEAMTWSFDPIAQTWTRP
jgi:hypothetical protein